jgi:hypothetical protein
MKILDFSDKKLSEIPWCEILLDKVAAQGFILIHKNEQGYFQVLKGATSSLEPFPNPTLGIFPDLDNARLFAKAYTNNKFQSDVLCTAESEQQKWWIAINKQKVDLPDGIYDAKWSGHNIEIIVPKKESDSFDNSIWVLASVASIGINVEIKVEITSGMLYIVK